MTEKTCNSCIHFGACSKWTDFPKQCGVPVCASFAQQSEGEWIDKPTGAYGRMQSWCSACGKHSGIGGIESNRHKPYCPNCGARMKGAKLKGADDEKQKK
jgi:hypothetical protein